MDSQHFYEYLLSKGYDRRESQEEFISLVEEVIEEGGVRLIEAPTGTGKTFGYLIPIITSGRKAIISTGTKILQDQLRRDIEFLTGHYKILTGREIEYLVIKGKANYLCVDRLNKEEIEHEHRMALKELMENGWDGDLSLTDLPVDTAQKVNIDEDYCTYAYRKLCPHRNSCYYWSKLKLRELKADILVVNHALLALKEFEDTREKVLVIDEAHELDRYLTLASTTGVSLYYLREIIGYLEKLLGEEIKVSPEGFFRKHFGKLFENEGDELSLESLTPYIGEFRTSIYEPLKAYLNRLTNKLREEILEFLNSRLMISFKLKEYILDSHIIEYEVIERFKAGYEEPEEEERELIEKLKKVEFLDSKLYKLGVFTRLAENEDNSYGYKVSRRWSKKLQTYNYRLEMFPVFPRGVIQEEDYKGIILTSATVDPEDIKFTTGIEGDFFPLKKNFDYSDVTFIIKNTNPKRDDWKEQLIEAYEDILNIHERVLVLLTNKVHMELLNHRDGTARQGESSLDKLIEFLREGKIKALIGLDSLWTGVDIRGEKGILMSKLPFDSPEDPTTYHRIRFLKSIGEDHFEYQRRKAFIKFRQGVGRLMRQKTDRGTIVLCDNRIWRYREFINFLKELGVNIVYEKGLTYRRT